MTPLHVQIALLVIVQPPPKGQARQVGAEQRKGKGGRRSVRAEDVALIATLASFVPPAPLPRNKSDDNWLSDTYAEILSKSEVDRSRPEVAPIADNTHAGPNVGLVDARSVEDLANSPHQPSPQAINSCPVREHQTARQGLGQEVVGQGEDAVVCHSCEGRDGRSNPDPDTDSASNPSGPLRPGV